MNAAAARELARLARLRRADDLPAGLASAPPAERAEALRLVVGASGLVAPRAEALAPSLRTGVPALDAWLGGWPAGRATELVGPASAGKTTLALRALRLALESPGQRPAALVDLSRAVVPRGAWAKRLLVVRPRQVALGLRALDVLLGSASFSLVVLVVPSSLKALPETVRVRTARLCREGGTALLACSERPLLGASSALRLELVPAPEGHVVARATKNRQGPVGETRLPWLAEPAP